LSRDRLKKLAASIDRLIEKDDQLLRKMEEVAQLRRAAAVQLHSICAHFVNELNQLLANAEIRMDPPEYEPANFQEDGPNLFQINVRGRILQIRFEATPELVSSEEFRVPYTLAGSIRCFNQHMLEQDLIEEQLLFFCLERHGEMWRYFDPRTYRTGPFNQDYLVFLMEQVV